MSQAAPTILVCLAATPRAAAVVAIARLWADLWEAELSFLHVTENIANSRDRMARYIPSDVLSQEEIHFKTGRPDWVICNEARRLGASLVMLGALEQEGLVTSILGSVARRVARRAPCSVLLLTKPSEFKLKHLVTSVAFNKTSTQMLQSVLKIAKRHELQSLHVIHEYDSYSRLLRIIGKRDMGEDDYRDQIAHEEMFQLSELLASLDTEGLPLTAKCLDGHIGQEAVDYAHDHNADLLVIPAPDRLGFWDRFFKHPTETILEHLPCSLMLYRETKEQAS
ncbi:MAG: universal stress protein [Pirellulaceae bacterium]